MTSIIEIKNSEQEMELLINHAKLIVFKDELQANLQETDASLRNADPYISAYLKVDFLTQDERDSVINNYTELNPYYKSLFDKYEIPYYVSRLAKDLDIIKEPLFFNDSILTDFKTTYSKILKFFFATVYNKAMESDYNYRNFCKFVVVTMTIINLIDNKCSKPFDVNVLDEYSLNNFLYSFGITFFNNFPIKYKRKLVSSLNRLISEKGSNQVLLDILDVFDFQNIDIFKYYLIKNYSSNISDLDTDIRFLITNINNPSINNAIINNDYRIETFESVTNNDEYWEVSKDELEDIDFDYVASKYFSVEATYDLFERTSSSITVFNFLKQIKLTNPNYKYLLIEDSTISNSPIEIQDLLGALNLLVINNYSLPDQIIHSFTGNVQSFPVTLVPSLNPIQTELQPYKFSINKDINFTIFNKALQHNLKMKNLLLSNIKSSTNNSDFKNYIRQYRNKVNASLTNTQSYYNNFSNFYDYLKFKNQDLGEYLDKIISENNYQKGILELLDILALYTKQLSLVVNSDSIQGLVEILKQTIEVFKSYTITLRAVEILTTAKERNFFKFTESFIVSSSMDLPKVRLLFNDVIMDLNTTSDSSSTVLLVDSFDFDITGSN
jgi:hypothetical protein